MEEFNTQSADKEVFGASRLSIFEWLIYFIIALGVIGAEAVVMLNFGHVYGWNGIGVLAQIGAVAGGAALLILPMKIYKATALFTPQWWMSMAFLFIEALILGGNVVVAYNTMSGVELSVIEQSWRHIVPATSLAAVFGASIVFIANPNARVVATEMAAKIITATSRAEEYADNARMALRRSRLARKRIATQEEIETSAEITKMQNEAALAAQFQAEYLAAAKQDPAVIEQLRVGARERARIDALRITGQLLGVVIEGTATPVKSPALSAPTSALVDECRREIDAVESDLEKHGASLALINRLRVVREKLSNEDSDSARNYAQWTMYWEGRIHGLLRTGGGTGGMVTPPSEAQAKPGTPSDRAARGWQKAVKRVVKPVQVQTEQPAAPQPTGYDMAKIRAVAQERGKVSDLEKATGKKLEQIEVSDLERVANSYGVTIERAMRYVGIDPESVRAGKP